MLKKWTLGTIAVGSLLAGSSVNAADVAVTPTYIAPPAPAAVVPAPPPVEFYIGGGGLYSTGIGREINFGTPPVVGTLLDQPSGGFAPLSNGEFARFAPFGYAGVRLPYRGVFFGLEGEYDFSRRSAESVLDSPGTVTPFGPAGANTSRYSARVSDRAALFSTVFVPVGGIELFGKLGVAYWRSEDTFSITYNSPLQYSTDPNSVIPTTAQNVFVSAKRDVFAPVLGGGAQVPLGSFFVRLEGQVEFANTKTVTLPYNDVITGVTGFTRLNNGSLVPVVSTRTTPGNVNASYIGSSDAKFLVSVGYKW